MASSRTFPIKQGVACQLKWSWNTLRLVESSSACCHRVQGVELTPENFNDIHNHPTWVKHREMQLAGSFPQEGCQYCESIEKAGGISDRILHLHEEDVYPLELDGNPLATHVTPRMLEIFINNRCNLSCIYCDESNSSKIQHENKKFGYDVPGIDKDSPIMRNIIPRIKMTSQYEVLLEKFFEYLESKYPTLRKLNVLGGEPFYQKEFFRLVDFLLERENKNLDFTTVTNLMVSRDILEEHIDKMKHALIKRKLRQVSITASIDCLGREQEYVRHGIELDKWMANFEYLAKHKWLYITINNTITSLTIKTLPDLLKYINGFRKHRQINHSFGLVDGRPHLRPEIFGSGYFDNEIHQIIDLMPKDNDLWNQKSIEYMQGIKRKLDQSTPDLEKQHYLYLYLDEIDRRRGTSWKSIFPWLEQHTLRETHVV